MSRRWLEEQLAALTRADDDAATATRRRAEVVLRPTGALARLDEVAVWVAGWHRTERPMIERPAALVFAANHGVAAAGVSKYPVDITASMVAAFKSGSSTISAFAEAVGATVDVVDVGVDVPSDDLRFRAAVSPARYDDCVDAARRAVDALDTDLLVVGEMGIGNTTAAAALAGALLGAPLDRLVGRGTGVDDEALAVKHAAVTTAVERVRHVAEPLELLGEVGGLELVAMAAAIVAARQRSIPVILDGYVVSTAALALHRHRSDALDHCWAGHRSAEPGHGLVLTALGKRPLLELDLRLGEASGAMAAVPLVRLACAGISRVPTFDEWLGTDRPDDRADDR